MLIPIFGELITSIGLLLCTYFDQTPVQVAAITETLFSGLTGEREIRERKSIKCIAELTFAYSTQAAGSPC